MLMFLTQKTKTDVLHILVRTHLLVLTCQQSYMLLVIIDQICQKRSRSIWIMVQVRAPARGRCSNLVKNMLTRFFEGSAPGNFCRKPRPSREIPLLRKGRDQYYEYASKKFLPQTIYIISVLFMVT